MRYKKVLALLVIFLFILVTSGIGLTYAYYGGEITGAVTGKTSNLTGEISVAAGTHTNIIPSSTTVDNIYFYVKNYTGTDSNPSVSSEVRLSYNLSFSLPTWGSGCTNPVSYKLYKIDESDNSETQITLSNNATGAINFGMISAERDYYRLALQWNTAYNSATCYAGKTSSVSITANIYQTDL